MVVQIDGGVICFNYKIVILGKKKHEINMLTLKLDIVIGTLDEVES